MQNVNSAIRIILMILIMTGVIACGDDGDDKFGGNVRVVDLGIDNSVFSVGSSQVVYVPFSFSANDVIDDGRHVILVIRLPVVVKYRGGTAEIKRQIDDLDINPRITDCPTGDSFLLFDMGRSELFQATNPGGDADAELRLTVDGVTPGGANLDATARSDRDNVAFDCSFGLAAQRTLAVEVIP